MACHLGIQGERGRSQETSGLKNGDGRVVSPMGKPALLPHFTTAQDAFVPTVEKRKLNLRADNWLVHSHKDTHGNHELNLFLSDSKSMFTGQPHTAGKEVCTPEPSGNSTLVRYKNFRIASHFPTHTENKPNWNLNYPAVVLVRITQIWLNVRFGLIETMTGILWS